MRVTSLILAALLCGLPFAGRSMAADDEGAGSPPEREAVTLQRIESIDLKPGDRWTYDVLNDITGEKEGTATYLLTEVVGDTLSVQMTRDPGNGKPSWNSLLLFDKNWNFLEDSVWKRTPGSPTTGIRLPLDQNTKWETTYQATKKPDVVIKPAAHSEVKGVEDVVLPFNKAYLSFKIETVERSVSTDGTKFGTTSTFWYAPSVNRYVKKIHESRTNGHLTSRSIELLKSYSRRRNID